MKSLEAVLLDIATMGTASKDREIANLREQLKHLEEQLQAVVKTERCNGCNMLFAAEFTRELDPGVEYCECCAEEVEEARNDLLTESQWLMRNR